jgi:hypothetical protein
MYEVYDKRTGEAVSGKSDGRPIRSGLLTSAFAFVAAYNDSEALLHRTIIDRCNIPAGAELDVRPVSVEVKG